MTRDEAKDAVRRMAEALVFVQPMDPTLMRQLMDAGRDEKTLVEEGYQPVSSHRILWIKREKP